MRYIVTSKIIITLLIMALIVALVFLFMARIDLSMANSQLEQYESEHFKIKWFNLGYQSGYEQAEHGMPCQLLSYEQE